VSGKNVCFLLSLIFLMVDNVIIIKY
jgi:hypothetical protein